MENTRPTARVLPCLRADRVESLECCNLLIGNAVAVSRRLFSAFGYRRPAGPRTSEVLREIHNAFGTRIKKLARESCIKSWLRAAHPQNPESRTRARTTCCTAKTVGTRRTSRLMTPERND